MNKLKTGLNLSDLTLGIELGSTRIKGVIIDQDNHTIASNDFVWENEFHDGIWTYDLNDAWEGIQAVFSMLKKKMQTKYGIELNTIGAIGISGMMHGYLPFDKKGHQIARFRTWRNTTTEEAAHELSELLQFNIPHRWSVAHLYQAILNQEEHVENLDYLTTLSGYIHWKLTGKKVLGVGDASGMFPIDSSIGDYNEEMSDQFNRLIQKHGYNWEFKEVFPKVLLAGEDAGELTAEGAKLIDPTGTLQAGIPLCAPEGDAGTGMVATNSILEQTGNVSAGTSIFSMIVLEKPLSDYYPEIDIVTTPDGKDVAMVHCNNFTSDINAWTQLFKEVVDLLGFETKESELFEKLFKQALKADKDIGQLVHCNYYAGEPITDTNEGRPLFARMPDSDFNLANFMKSQIYSALATLKIGMDLLTEKEQVKISSIVGHGGFFKTEYVGQKLMADALEVPITLMSTAGEGGAWGIALLAQYHLRKASYESLDIFLKKSVFKDIKGEELHPTIEGIADFKIYMKRYHAFLDVERKAIEVLI